jgi:hypothetical protein
LTSLCHCSFHSFTFVVWIFSALDLLISLPPFFPLFHNCCLDLFRPAFMGSVASHRFTLSCFVVCLRHGVMASAIPGLTWIIFVYFCKRYSISIVHDPAERGALYKPHGNSRLPTQSTIKVLWPSWYHPVLRPRDLGTPAYGMSNTLCLQIRGLLGNGELADIRKISR